MKKSKIVFFVLTIILIIPSMVYSAAVTRITAEQVATNWYSERNENASNDFEIVESFIEKENAENIYYIFNFDKTGFVMVSADDATIPVLGYVFKHNYTLENHPPQFDAMLANFKEQIVFAKENNLSASKEAQDEWGRLNVSTENFEIMRNLRDVSPLITSNWNQGSTWNTYCPVDAGGPGGYVYAGCAAVAMAQVMNFWQHPSTGTGSHGYTHATYGYLSANFGTTTYSYPMNYTTPTNASRELLYHCGVAMEMDYGPSGSGAWVGQYSPSVLTALETYFKYNTTAYFALKSGYSNTAWENMIKADLDNGRPLVYRGYDPDSPYGGHAFNLDGYQGTNYFHFNWGWSGSYNGYFYLSSLNPGGMNFTNDQGAIFSLYPITGGAPGVPTNPNPTNGATGISIDTMISWVNGANTVDVDVYFSSNQTLVTNKDASVQIYSGTAITSTDPSGVFSLDYDTTYYWRVVCKNSVRAETDGPVWSFTTESQGGTPATLSYHNSAYYYWNCPDTYGDDEFGVRYTPADACDLDSLSVCFYNTVGTPTGITIHIYDVDYGTNASGLPNVEIGSLPVNIADINLSPTWTTIDLRSLNLSFTAGEEFFITYTVDGGVFGVTEVQILSDDGSSAAYRSVENWNGIWGYMLDDWGGDYQFLMSAHIFYAAAVPPTLVINPVSIDFQRTAIGGWKTETVTLQNVGGGQVVINSVSIAGDPQIELYDYNTYPDTLFSGESISFLVAYGPDAVVTNSATITVSETSSRLDHFIPVNGEGYYHNSWASGSPVFDQPPIGNQGDYGWSMMTSDDAPGYMHAENFWSIPQPITAIEFWGINWYYDGGWIQSDVEDPMTFEIKFYTDHTTEYSPDVEVASFSIPLYRTTVDTVTFSSGPVYKYRAELPTSVILTDGWVSIRGTSVSTPDDPWFLWSTSPVGDLGNVAYDYPNTEWDFDDVDLAFALYTNVLLPPADVTVSISGTDAIISWTPEAGRNYNVYSDSDPYGSFSTLVGTVTDGSGSITDPIGVDEKKFYRVTTATFQIRETIKVAPAIYKSKFIRSIEDSFLMDGNELKK